MGWVTLIKLFLKALFENFGTILSLVISALTWFNRKKISEQKLEEKSKTAAQRIGEDSLISAENHNRDLQRLAELHEENKKKFILQDLK